MLKSFLIILILISNIYGSKKCFKDKSLNKIICYKKVYDKNKVYRAKHHETYYKDQNDRIYAFEDKIEVKFHAVGAILTILKDYEVDFYDKKKGESYILKVRNKNELFSIASNLNSLSAVKKAVPLKIRKYTRVEVERRQKAAKARQERAMQKAAAGNKATVKGGMGGGIQGNFLDPDANKQGTNFLKGGKE